MMNEELIRQIVSRMLSEPTFQALLKGTQEGNMEEPRVVKKEGLVLLNYVPDLEPVINALKLSHGTEYTLSLLPSDQTLPAKAAKPTLPEGLTWITPQDALNKKAWGKSPCTHLFPEYPRQSRLRHTR